ncbi:MAG: class I SAM-dependent methyltransferase [Deltaproteobacteria bacterium]|nr:class I SAM-dependent methyltransferase [Deltaproteobacteria bacterium]
MGYILSMGVGSKSVMGTDYVHVTELAGDDVSREQVERMYSRYDFARQYCSGKDVIEIGCGSGQGLGYLAGVAGRTVGGDLSEPLLSMAGSHYKGRIPLVRLDAHALPFRDHCSDVVILFEAVYYLAKPEEFVRECTRVLRPKGTLIMCSANKDLPDFNPSPHSHNYFSPPQFAELLRPYGFDVQCLGDCEVDYGSLRQKVFSFVKKTMVRWNLMPKTMAGKKIFKRIVFGKLVAMPAELTNEHGSCPLPTGIDATIPDRRHKVIFVVGRKDV